MPWAARRKNDWVFVGRGLAVMSHEAPWRLLQHMGYVDADGVPITLHGFRSTFSEWGNQGGAADIHRRSSQA
jgi:hypothetical protein